MYLQFNLNSLPNKMFGENVVVVSVLIPIIFGVICAKDLNRTCSQPTECISISSCQPDKDRHEYVKSFECDRNETDVFVCCNDYRANIDLPDKRECGLTMPSTSVRQIVGGTEASLGEYPWVALLEYEKSYINNIFTVSCVGSLINSQYILTAAHCLNRIKIQNQGQLTRVHLGEHNLDTSIDCIKPHFPKNGYMESIFKDKKCIIIYCSKPVLKISVEESIAHPEYDSKTQHNDIGLIRLSKKVQYTRYISPICLPSTVNMAASSENAPLEVTGWGHTFKPKRSRTKQKVSVPVFNHDVCATKYKPAFNISESQLCAGGIRSQDSCRGDSGASLMKYSNGSYAVEGIVSFAYNACGEEGWPSVYTKVSSFESWIKANIRM